MPDHTLPHVAVTRVERAVEAWMAGVAPRLVMAGRCGLSTEPGPVTEAQAMADAAARLGVPSDALLLEELSRDTLGNAYFVREMYLEPLGWRSIRVVTSDFHLSRAAWCFRKILGNRYDFSFTSAFSGFSPTELVGRALEECRISIFLNEWLASINEGDEHAVDRLMNQEHPGYADAPSLTREEITRRLEEIDRMARRVGIDHLLAADARGESAAE
jgi:hypothetical protein